MSGIVANPMMTLAFYGPMLDESSVRIHIPQTIELLNYRTAVGATSDQTVISSLYRETDEGSVLIAQSTIAVGDGISSDDSWTLSDSDAGRDIATVRAGEYLQIAFGYAGAVGQQADTFCVTIEYRGTWQ